MRLVAEVTGLALHAQGDLPEQGEHQGAHGVHAQGHDDLTAGGGVFGDGLKHVGSETTDEQAEALVDPGSVYPFMQKSIAWIIIIFNFNFYIKSTTTISGILLNRGITSVVPNPRDSTRFFVPSSEV